MGNSSEMGEYRAWKTIPALESYPNGEEAAVNFYISGNLSRLTKPHFSGHSRGAEHESENHFWRSRPIYEIAPPHPQKIQVIS